VAGRFEAKQFFGKDGADAVVFHAESGASLEGVYEGEDVGAGDERFGVCTHEAGEGDEDAVDFGLLFFEEADELVVLLDGFEGFDVNGLA